MTGAQGRRGGARRFVAVRTASVLAAGAVLLVAPAGAAVAASPTVTLAPAGNYRDGNTVSVTVGPNTTFTPHTRIVILECADPGGTPAALPTSYTGCDGNTIQGDTVLVQADGSFVEHAYTMYALPSLALGEKPAYLPACSATQACVLFVGQDQNDFSQPKVFSRPFTVAPPTAVAAGSVGGTTTAPSAPAAASAAVTLPAATLAYTGEPSRAPQLLVVGIGLVGLGLIGRRLVRRGQR